LGKAVVTAWLVVPTRSSGDEEQATTNAAAAAQIMTTRTPLHGSRMVTDLLPEADGSQ
jgi:hypothetical protein